MPLVPLEPQVTGAKLVLPVLLALLVLEVALVNVVRLVLLVPMDLLVLLVLLANLVLKEKREPKGLRVKMASLVQPDLSELLAHLVLMAHLVLLELVVMEGPPV